MSSAPRRGLGLLVVLGGFAVLLVSVGCVVAVALLSGGPAAPPTTTFSAGQPATVPDAGTIRGELVVYGADVEVEGSRTQAVGCQVVSPSGSERVVTSTSGADPVEVGGQELVPVVTASGWRPGDTVTCSGDQAASFEPLAVGTTGVPATARVVAGVVAVVALVFGLVLLVVGSRLLR